LCGIRRVIRCVKESSIVELWQVILVFAGGPIALFGAIWALVWLTTGPGTVPPGVAQPSEEPSGGLPPPEAGEDEKKRSDEAPAQLPGEGGCQAGGEE
jgi:hypothetical protein